MNTSTPQSSQQPNNQTSRFSLGSTALLYIGALMGAGFASGKEIDHFFGRFGYAGLIGLGCVGLCFILLAPLTLRLAQLQRSADLAQLLCPSAKPFWQKLIRYSLRANLYIAFCAMLSAGGAVCQEQFGLPLALGNALTAAAATFTAYWGIQGIRRALHKTVPLLLLLSFSIALLLLGQKGSNLTHTLAAPSGSGWLASAIAYLSYNMIGALPLLASIGAQDDRRNILWGGAVGGLGLFLGALLILLALASGGTTTATMTMLYLAEQLHPALAALYAGALLLAIYSVAVTCLYGALPRTSTAANRRRFASTGAAGYLLSLIGFDRMVAYVYPIQGLLGLFILIILLISYYKTCKKQRYLGKHL